ncbi:MAG: hypothetical protein GYB41_16410 [Oceanospirillales bacterium]|nr:hypothetical protein [Oceanospirillales bacterium]
MRFHKANNFAFAANWLYVPVHNQEASRLARQFPILFYPLPNGGAMPCMLLKSKDKSAFSTQMHWQGGILPDVLRLYPFGFHRDQKRSSLAVYPTAPHFRGNGEKIITSKGKPTRRLQGIIKALAPIQQAFDQTQPIMQELLALNVLQPVTFSLLRADGTRARVSLLACPDTAVIKQQSLSPALRTLLYVHQQSCRRLFKHAHMPTAAANTKAHTGTVAPASVHELARTVCDRFSVSLDDLKSRKRSDIIKQARHTLAVEARDSSQLTELAGLLQRSVDTLRKWI